MVLDEQTNADARPDGSVNVAARCTGRQGQGDSPDQTLRHGQVRQDEGRQGHSPIDDVVVVHVLAGLFGAPCKETDDVHRVVNKLEHKESHEAARRVKALFVMEGDCVTESYSSHPRK